MNLSEYKRSLLPTKEELRLWAKTPIDQNPYKMALERFVKAVRYERAMLGLPIAIFNIIDSDGDKKLFEVFVTTTELNIWGYLDGEVFEGDDDYGQNLDLEEVDN